MSQIRKQTSAIVTAHSACVLIIKLLHVVRLAAPSFVSIDIQIYMKASHRAEQTRN